ncbi:MAG: VCBS repeat-containing protein [Polyangiales bacterium]
MKMGTSGVAQIAGIALGIVVAACGPSEVHCEGGAYFSDVTRGCVGIGRYREENDGAYPDGYAYDDVAMVDVPTMDAGLDDARDAVATRDAADAAMDVVAVVDPMLAPPRAIAPMSTSTVTSQRPTLRWATSGSVDGAVVEVSRTRDFAVRAHQLRASGDRVRLPSALSAGVWFWRLRGRSSARNAEGTASSPVWWFRVGARSADGDRDVSWGSELDVNGDGYGDVAVGSVQSGRVEVYYGGSSGIGATPSATLREPSSNTTFGNSVANAGDVNGDGYGDLIIGAYNASAGTRFGTATLFYGSDSGVSASRARTLAGGTTRANFGLSVGGAGDVNGDGFADVLVGEPGANPGGRSNAGVAHLYLGTPTGIGADASQTLEGVAAEDAFGSVVVGLGDVDGDQFADVAISAVQADPGGRSNAGSTYVFRGSSTGIDLRAPSVLEGVAANDRFGSSVAGAGDVNGDGLSDFVVATPHASRSGVGFVGTARVFHGSRDAVTVVAARTLDGATAFEGVGGSVAIARDVNLDGFADMIIGASGASPGGRLQAGAASLFRGGPMGTSAVASQLLEGASAGDSFASAASCSGDVNGDGFTDCVIGAAYASPAGRGTAGEAAVFHGSSSGVVAVPARVLEGSAIEDSFGAAVARLFAPAHSRRSRWSARPQPASRQCSRNR